MSVLIIAISILFIGYMFAEILDIKKRVTRLTQENAILWEIVREQEEK